MIKPPHRGAYHGFSLFHGRATRLLRHRRIWGLVVISMFFGGVSWVHRFDYAGRLASTFALALAGMVIFAGFAFYFTK